MARKTYQTKRAALAAAHGKEVYSCKGPPRGKGERKAGTGVETEESEANQEIEKAEEIEKGQVDKGKTWQSKSDSVWLWLKEKRKSEVISARCTV